MDFSDYAIIEYSEMISRVIFASSENVNKPKSPRKFKFELGGKERRQVK